MPDLAFASPVADAAIDLRRHIIGNAFRSFQQVKDLRARFERDLVVVLPCLIDAEVLPALVAEAAALVRDGRRRDFQMPGYETPRKLTAIGGRTITARSPLITSLYSSIEIRNLVAGIVGQAVFECRHCDEFLVLNHLGARDDTHGWHLDDPTWALVIVFEAPGPYEGGRVEIVPPVADLGEFTAEAAKAVVAQAGALGRIVELELSAGDAYLLRADKCLHRVTPLGTPHARRTALNLAFEETSTPEHAKYLHTTTLMYGDA
jgi:hypothetical protein